MTIPPEIRAVFDQAPDLARARLEEMRALILAAAETADIGGIEETLKWGQPSYLPIKKRIGTTVRLGWSPSDPENCALYVHCQTNLVDQYRDRFPDEFRYDGNRVVLVPVEGNIATTALQHIASMALTYHRDKR